MAAFSFQNNEVFGWSFGLHLEKSEHKEYLIDLIVLGGEFETRHNTDISE